MTTEATAETPTIRTYRVEYNAARDGGPSETFIKADRRDRVTVDHQSWSVFYREGRIIAEIPDRVISIIEECDLTGDNDLAGQLARVLLAIEAADTDYDTRYGLVLDAMTLARKLRLPVGIRIDEKEPEWPVVHIELPTGQVTWHMPQHPAEWDGHDTATKYARCRAYAESVGA